MRISALCAIVIAFAAEASDQVVLRPVASGLHNPVQVATAHDGSGRLFVAEQAGRIWLITGGQRSLEPFLDISDITDCCENGGLLSFVFHPHYAENGRFFVLYVNRSGDTVLAEYSASGRVLITVDQPLADIPNHHGGTLQFGSDGFLYISIGDGGVAAGVTNRAQDPALLLGKLLRIDVDNGTPYAIPADNPFVGVPGTAPEIWAVGLRNPWRFNFDAASGQLIIGDVGQDSWEELNVVDVKASRGANFGWPRMEGRHCFPPAAACDSSGLTLPVIEYSHGEGCSITAGDRYRGTLIPSLAGKYLYADWCSGVIWAASNSTGEWRTTVVTQTSHAIVSLGEDDSGEIYVVDYLGSVLRLEPLISRRHAARH